LEERTIGGLGIHLVRTLMDGLEYKRQADRNILIIKKKT
jgi:anti-sigma regulatory factor (Ser/Thr protein kinase)